ncbi:MAG: hypothetical protein PVJ42_09855 [bacterium]
MRNLIICCVLVLAHNALASEEPALPEPTGPYAVGTAALLFTDMARPEIFTDDPDDHREVTARAWYPAEPAPEVAPAPYYENGGDIVRMFDYPAYLANLVTHSLPGARVAEAEERYPVILSNHGWGEHAVQNTVLMEELASHGYVVFSLAHHYEAKFWTYPDGRVEFINMGSPRFQSIMQEQSKPEAMQLLQASFEAREVAAQESLFQLMVETMPTLLGETPRHWAEDISFVIGELDSLNKSNALFAGRLDLEKLGVMGMSMGGAAAGQVCLDGDRIRAAINMDGGLLGDLADTVVAVPMMYVGSRRFIGYDEVFSAHASNDSYTLIIGESDHYDLTDFTLLNRNHMMIGTVDGERMLKILNDYTLAFFDFYLKGIDSGLLTGQKKPYREAEFQAHRKH